MLYELKLLRALWKVYCGKYLAIGEIDNDMTKGRIYDTNASGPNLIGRSKLPE